MKWLEFIKRLAGAPTGAVIALPAFDLTLEETEQRSARLLIWLEETYPSVSDQDRLSALEAAMWWLTLLMTAFDRSASISAPTLTVSDPGRSEKLDLDSRTARTLDLVLQEHAGSHFEGTMRELRLAVEVAAAKAHRHYPDGRPDCPACIFFDLFK